MPFPRSLFVTFTGLLVSVCAAGEEQARPRVCFADTVSGRPFSKDPALVIVSRPVPALLFNAALQGPNSPGLGHRHRREPGLVDWQKAGELPSDRRRVAEGFCAPGAIVLGGKVHLFYQTYGNGAGRHLPCVVRRRAPFPAGSGQPCLPSHRRLELWPGDRRRGDREGAGCCCTAPRGTRVPDPDAGRRGRVGQRVPPGRGGSSTRRPDPPAGTSLGGPVHRGAGYGPSGGRL